MLYVTTRSKHDPCTAHRTMNQDRASDGGLFVPFRLPELTAEDVQALAERSFGQNVADTLNIFFSAKLTGWDVDFCIGRYPMKLKNLNSRTIVAETWHNMDWNFARVVRSLADRIHPDGDCIGAPTNWMDIAVRIAMLFGIFGELLRTGSAGVDRPVDIAVTSGSFAEPMAAWYARAMGLPIANIICGCNENGAPWDLLHRGEMDTDTLSVATTTPEADFALPPDLERLICGALDQEEALRYWWCCTEGRAYIAPEERFEELRRGMFAAVVSKMRVDIIIPSVNRTSSYVLNPYAALAYGALSDYRAKTGESRTAVIISDKSPLCDAQTVARAMHITPQELKQQLGAR